MTLKVASSIAAHSSVFCVQPSLSRTGLPAPAELLTDAAPGQTFVPTERYAVHVFSA